MFNLQIEVPHRVVESDISNSRDTFDEMGHSIGITVIAFVANASSMDHAVHSERLWYKESAPSMRKWESIER